MKGGIVLDGFPSTGLVNAIASECLIRSLGTELFAVIDSPEFPPLSIISDFMPHFPARLYINEGVKVAFFISELNIHPAMQSTIARTILNWARQNKCKMIISVVGIPADVPTKGSDDSVIQDQQPVIAVTSTQAAAEIAKENGFIQLRSGTIRGIPATLLNEGSLVGQDVIVLMVNTMADAPDFRAATLISTSITKLVPGLSCDIGALMVEAQLIENRIKKIRNEQKESYIA